ncbi:transglycosylase SLT domain-containing protein [Rothia sp. AR01]|uniref:Transglycosylase SLT domain-containing protein n=1 Tax=Rothia santali TaxID=2949643 RepID=A0A9X2H8T5_9MICC|nr:CHAP domain-containing protein [Rothia santali]MCP3425174.1 transglycosylase SLT domain-containing protein [Rothia santali]
MGEKNSGGLILGIVAAVVICFGVICTLPVILLGGGPEPAAAGCAPAGSSDNPGGGQAVAGEIPKKEWADAIVDASKVSGVPSHILAGQIEQESQWNPDAQSPAGASGLTQFIPSTWEKYSHGKPQSDPLAAIQAQGEYMRDIMKSVKDLAGSSGTDQVDLALAGYNAGEGAVHQYGGIPPYPETENYVPLIKEKAKAYESGDSTESEDLAEESEAPEADSSDDESEDQDEGSSSAEGQNCASGEKPKKEGGYSGGETSGEDDYPWPDSDTSAANAITAFYNRQCVDFAFWRVNQQLGAHDPNKPKYTNTSFVEGMRLGNGYEWAKTWEAKGWPVDNEPEVGAVAHFAPGASGSHPEYGHVAVVKEVRGDKVLLEEYNALVPYGYDTREMDAAGVSNYLHIPDSEKA